jgi:hypothetical protein
MSDTSGARGERRQGGGAGAIQPVVHYTDTQLDAVLEATFPVRPAGLMWSNLLLDLDIKDAAKQLARAGTITPELKAAMGAKIQATTMWSLVSKQAAPSTQTTKGSGSKASTTAQDIAAAAAAITNEAATLGLSLDTPAINSLASTVVKQKWSGDMLTQYLTSGVDFSKLGAGSLTAGVDNIKKMAKEQLLNISDTSAQEYSRRMLSGEMSQEGLQALFVEQAKKNYAWATPTLDKGITMQAYLMPSRDFIANQLEKPTEAVDMMDPKYLSMMQTIDAKTGQARAASLSEMQVNARQDPDFAKTNKARAMTQNAALAIRSFMGA